MKVTDFDYRLPDELIAQDPAPFRDESRLLVVKRNSPGFEHREFRQILEYLRAGDLLVLNETRVMPARLLGVKDGTGGKVEVLLLQKLGEGLWEGLVRPGRRIQAGTRLVFAGGSLLGEVLGPAANSGRVIRFESTGPVEDAIRCAGIIPLPPYIRKYPDDPGRYQTVYARTEGSVAAPTAGLHFTESLLDEIKAAGVAVASVLLHVGVGTFRPVQAEDVEDHRMHREYYEVPPETAQAINRVVRERPGTGRIVAVGTTTVRCLETASLDNGLVSPGRGETSLFIYPGYRFKVVEAMLTNFHLPRSTLLMMVSAFAGREKMLQAYSEAVKRRYRFFSFGDAMLIL